MILLYALWYPCKAMGATAVIGDMISSRRSADRAELQTRFRESLAQINSEFANRFESRLIVLAGDEFQGLLKSPVHGIWLCDLIEERLQVPFRFGIGYGELTTDSARYAIGTDGPAWHHARKAIEESKKRGDRLTFRGFGDHEDLYLTAAQDMLDFQWQKLTKSQKQVLKALERGSTQVEVAAQLGKVQQYVSRTARASGFRQRMALSEAIMEILSQRRESIDDR